MLAALALLFHTRDRDSCFLDTWKNKFKDCLGAVNERIKNKNFKDIMTDMENSGKITVAGSKIFLASLKDDLVTETMFQGLLN